jgi:hypothetical protein
MMKALMAWLRNESSGEPPPPPQGGEWTCSFCDRKSSQAKRLIVGNVGAICEGCIWDCVECLNDESEWR